MLVPKLSENSHISVRNLSENCQLQKTVRKLSEMCQISVRKLSDANMCQNSIRKDLEMHQKCVSFYKCVRKRSEFYLENSQISVIILSEYCQSQQIIIKQSKMCPTTPKMSPQISINVSEISQMWYFWQITDCFPNKPMTVSWHIYKNWHISDAFQNLFR